MQHHRPGGPVVRPGVFSVGAPGAQAGMQAALRMPPMMSSVRPRPGGLPVVGSLLPPSTPSQIPGMFPGVPGMGTVASGNSVGPPLIPASSSAAKHPQPPAPKSCPLHKKAKPKCRFCTQFADGQQAIKDWEKECLEMELNPEAPQVVDPNALLPMTNVTTFNMSTMVKDQLLASLYFKSLLGFAPPTRLSSAQQTQTRPPLIFQELVNEVYEKVEHVEPYTQHSATDPSTFLCVVFRFFTTGLTEVQLMKLLKHVDSPYLRLAGYLFVRFVLHPDWLLKYCEPLLFDKEVFQPHKDNTKHQVTVGEFVEETLQTGKLFELMMVRWSAAKRKVLEQFIAKVPQMRLRMDANRRVLSRYRQPGQLVECLTLDAVWISGETIQVYQDEDEDVAYTYVEVKRDNGTHEVYPLGRIILTTDEPEAEKKERERRERRANRRERSRSRSRSRSPRRRTNDDASDGEAGVDWSRERGDTTAAYAELLQLQKEKVFAQGREYQTRTGPSMRLATLSSGYKGSHSQRLAEEETSIRRRQETMAQLHRQRNMDEKDKDKHGKRREEEARQAAAQKAQIIEKYTANRRNDSSKGNSDGSDMLRLG
eukprot:GEMP01004143.1.p2 GENE.GEMP01004143.1~~GEMP01004143.1.p2  ORF type:complete len:594 (+),score=136.72 GEMP01004143.1:40-1821(+)